MKVALKAKKNCSKCKRKLLLTAFHIDKSKSTGRKSICAECSNSDDRAKKHNLNVRYSDYKKRAKKLGHIFDLTTEQFKQISSESCEYCGSFTGKSKDGKFTGVDRISAEQGYFEQNCVPCCMTCNYMKWTLGMDAFLKHVKKIAKYQEK